MAVDGTPGVKD